MSELVLPRVGRVERLNGGPVAYRVVDEAGDEVHAVSEFFRDLAASDCSPATLRSYAYDLLGWLRFLWTVDMAWDRATRVEARDYALWLGQARKQPRRRRANAPTPGAVNAVTGKPYPGQTYPAPRRPGGMPGQSSTRSTTTTSARTDGR